MNKKGLSLVAVSMAVFLTLLVLVNVFAQGPPPTNPPPEKESICIDDKLIPGSKPGFAFEIGQAPDGVPVGPCPTETPTPTTSETPTPSPTDTPEPTPPAICPPGNDRRFFIDEHGIIRNPNVCPSPSPTETPEPTPTPEPTLCVELPNGDEVGFSPEGNNRYAYQRWDSHPALGPCPTESPTVTPSPEP